MHTNMTFDEAFAAIEQIVQQIEQEQIPLDALAEKVKTARSLLAFCHEKLGIIENELKHKEQTDT